MLLTWGSSQGLNALMNSAEFIAGFADAGSGAVDLTLSKGTGSATFTRATTATTVNSAGLIVSVASGTPRSYYDPTTLAYLGYLAEGARTNLALYSQDRSQANWAKSLVTIGGSFTAPDGATSTVSKIQEDNNFGNHYIEQSVTKAASSITYTYSEYLKAAERSFVQLTLDDAAGNGYDCMFDLSAGTVSIAPTARGAGWSAASATIKAYPNGVYRATLTATSNTATTVRFIPLLSSNGTLNQTYSGTTGSGVFAWGAQLEAGSFASTYIPTTTASVTRNADVLTYPSAGNILGAVGSAYMETFFPFGTFTGGGGNVYLLDAGTNAAPLILDNAGLLILFDGTSVLSYGLVFTGPRTKLATSWGGSTSNGGLNGSSGTAGFDGDLNIGATMSVGLFGGGGSQPFCTIKNLRIFQTQLTASQLQAVTS